MADTLHSAIDDFHALIERDLTAAEEQLEHLRQAQIDQKVTFGDRAMAHSLRPTFLTEATYNAVQDTVYLIRQAILIIAATFFDDRRTLQEDLGLEDWEIEFASIPTNVIRLSALSRMDSFLTKDSFKFVEVNAESPAGVAYIHELARLYRSLPIFQAFERAHPVRFVSPMEHTFAALLRTYHEEFDGREERPTIAIVDRLDVPTIHEFHLLKGYFERMGCPTVVIDPRALDVRDGWIYANGRKIDILYRRLLMNEFYEIRDDCPAFLEGYVAQRTCYLNSFRGLSIDLVDFVRSNRRYFVIKPNDAYGGAGVTLGFAASQSEWDEAISKSFDEQYVVQEVVDIHREPFLVKVGSSWELVPTIIDLDPYLNGPLMGGCLTRTSASNLANVTAGGGTLPMFILRYTHDENKTWTAA